MEKKIIKLNVTSATGSENVLFSFEHPYIFKNLINILKREGVDVAIKPVPILNGLIHIPVIYNIGNVQLILRYNRNSFIQNGIAQLLFPVFRNVIMNKVDGVTLRDAIYDFFAALLTILNPFSYTESIKAAENVSGAYDTASDIQKSVTDNQRTLDEIGDILNRSRELTEEKQRIFDDIEAANQRSAASEKTQSN